MNFTDDDLKRLKDKLEVQPYSISPATIKALLARLEAAENPERQFSHTLERASLDCEDDIHLSTCRRCKADIAWRTAAGHE